jgi:hypothetical protein
MFQTKVYAKSKRTFYVCSIIYFEYRAVCKVMWTNDVERDRSQMTIWYMRTSCWVIKAINTHPE